MYCVAQDTRFDAILAPKKKLSTVDARDALFLEMQLHISDESDLMQLGLGDSFRTTVIGREKVASN